MYNSEHCIYSKGKVLWTEDAEMEVRRLFEEYHNSEEGIFFSLFFCKP